LTETTRELFLTEHQIQPRAIVTVIANTSTQFSPLKELPMITVCSATRQAALRRAGACWAIALMLFSLTGALPAYAANQQTQVQEKTADLPPLPLSPIELAEKNGTALRMSLKDVTRLALQNNLDIAISDTNEELYQQRIVGAYGAYDPILGFSLNRTQQQQPNTTVDQAGTGAKFSQSDAWTWSFTYQQAIRKTGATIAARTNSNWTDTNRAFNLFNPSYGANAVVQFTQPLWRNFRIDANRGQIRLVNLDVRTNDSTFRQMVTTTVSNIQSVYWDLVGAIRNYEIARESVKLGQITVRDNRKKVEIGTLAPISITEAEADLANREVSLLSTEERINNVENNLRALISNDRNAEIWRQTIVPTDSPEYVDYPVALEDAIATALKNRPELEQVDIQLEQNDINYTMDQNGKKWQVDFVASLGAVGSAGPSSTNQDLVGGFWHLYDVLFTKGYNNWALGVNVQIPLRSRSLDSSLAQLKIQKRQALMKRKGLEQQVQVEVRNAVQSLETSKKRVQQAKLARQLAQEQLTGEEKRFQAGLSENFRVLQRQNDLSSAQNQELQSLVTYKRAVITLQKSLYTLLESSDFQIAKSSSDQVPPFK
jgi:outer membrane protein